MRDLAGHFRLHGTLIKVERYGSGHINDTFLTTFDSSERGAGVPPASANCGQGGRALLADQASAQTRYIFQRINHDVFKNVPQLMENISRVTSHLASKAPGGDGRRTLTIVPALGGAPYHKTEAGDFWRVYVFVEGARTYDAAETPRQAFEAARAFGSFQQALADLPGDRLHETIPNFHHTPLRLEALQLAAEADVMGRKKEVLAELDFAFQREPEVGRLLDLFHAGDIPERVTHNDTKLNNVMLDDKTGEGICVVDLDTVMPGLSLYDFGDLVRFGTATGAEDETDLAKVGVSLPVFEAIVQGYITGAGNILTDAEWDHLVFAGRLMTYEVGIRFLTDYLQGDIYFRSRRPGHNRDRARNQLRLVARMEAVAGAMSAIVRSNRASL